MQLNEQPRPNLLVCPGFRFSPGKTKENIPVRNLPLITDAALLGLCFGRIAAAGDIRVIANPSVSASAVSVDELKGVFLATKTSLSDGSHVEPVLGGSGTLPSSRSISANPIRRCRPTIAAWCLPAKGPCPSRWLRCRNGGLRRQNQGRHRLCQRRRRYRRGQNPGGQIGIL